jgi:hypothetical protein
MTTTKTITNRFNTQAEGVAFIKNLLDSDRREEELITGKFFDILKRSTVNIQVRNGKTALVFDTDYGTVLETLTDSDKFYYMIKEFTPTYERNIMDDVLIYIAPNSTMFFKVSRNGSVYLTYNKD